MSFGTTASKNFCVGILCLQIFILTYLTKNNMVIQRAEAASRQRRRRRRRRPGAAGRARPVCRTRAGSTSPRPRWWRACGPPTTASRRPRPLSPETFAMRSERAPTPTRSLFCSRYTKFYYIATVIMLSNCQTNISYAR